VVLFGLAWVGLVFGLQIDIRVIRRLRPWHRWLGLVVPLVMGGGVGAGALVAGLPVPAACALAAVAAVPTSSTMEGLARGRAAVDRSALRLLKMVIAFSGIPAIFVFHTAFALWSPASALGGGPLPWWFLLMALVGVGVVLGYALLYLVRGVTESIHLLTLLTGSMAALAGAVAVLGLSPVPAAAAVGTVIVNRCIFPHRLLKVAHSLEQPLLVVLLVVIGASWTGIAFSWSVFVLMVVLRPLMATVAGWAAVHVANRQGVEISVPWLGAGLIPQGELAIVLLVAFLVMGRAPGGVLEGVVAALLINHGVGQWWLRQRLFRPPQPGSRQKP
jgi:hypothetical protein